MSGWAETTRPYPTTLPYLFDFQRAKRSGQELFQVSFHFFLLQDLSLNRLIYLVSDPGEDVRKKFNGYRHAQGP